MPAKMSANEISAYARINQ